MFRPFALASCAATITAALLVAMTALIKNSVAAPLPTQHRLDPFVSVPKPPAPPPQIEKPKAPPPPMPPPPTQVSDGGVDDWATNDPFVLVGTGPDYGDFDPRPNIEIGPAGTDDGPAIEVMPVQPIYPRSMMARGVEGSVVVAYDVNAAGRVANARVVSSTHGGFEKAAVDAIQRFRYQPRVVDGQPIATPGLQKQFTFSIER
ncbi:MAG: energy transducer TonB [Pseudomonadota bacterium]